MGKLKLDPVAVKAKIVELILEAAPVVAPGDEKMGQVLDKLAAWADEQLKWKWLGPLGIAAEMADGPAIREGLDALLQLLVQFVYDELKAAGRV